MSVTVSSSSLRTPRIKRRVTLSLIEAAKRGFDLFIGGELVAFRLSKAFQHGGQMRRIDGLRLSLVAGQGKHGARGFSWLPGQPTHRFEGFFQEFGHSQLYAVSPGSPKPLSQKSNFLNRINVIWVVQSHPQKYSCFLQTQITSIPLAVSFPLRGVSRSSRT